MEFKVFLVSVILFSMLIIASGTTISLWAIKYNPTITDDYSKDFSKLGEISDTAESQKGRINPQSGEASSDFETETFRGGYGILTNIFAPFRVVYGSGGIIDSAVTRWGLPSWLWEALISILTLSITFGIIAIIFRLARSAA